MGFGFGSMGRGFGRMAAVASQRGPYWLLRRGIWDDAGVWVDAAAWID